MVQPRSRRSSARGGPRGLPSGTRWGRGAAGAPPRGGANNGPGLDPRAAAYALATAASAAAAAAAAAADGRATPPPPRHRGDSARPQAGLRRRRGHGYAAAAPTSGGLCTSWDRATPPPWAGLRRRRPDIGGTPHVLRPGYAAAVGRATPPPPRHRGDSGRPQAFKARHFFCLNLVVLNVL